MLLGVDGEQRRVDAVGVDHELGREPRCEREQPHADRGDDDRMARVDDARKRHRPAINSKKSSTCYPSV